MKRGLIIIFILALLPSVFALSVTLNLPADANTSSSNTLTFNCSVSDFDFSTSSIKLFTNISGSWTQTGSTVSGNIPGGEFTVASIADGTYIWNCLAENSSGATAYASSNFTFTVSTGGFSGTIPNQTWTEDTNKTDAFDLDDYFTGATSYTTSGDSKITITIDANNLVTLTPDANFSGAETVTFTSNVGDSSNAVLLNVTNVNDPPYVIENISNQTLTKNTNKTIDLSNKFADHDNDTLNYSSDATHFTILQDGEDIIVVPEKDFTGSEEVTVTATDGTYDAVSNTFTVTIESTGNTRPELLSYTPTTRDQKVEVGSTLEFSLEFADAEDDPITFAWFVDDIEQASTASSFSFTPVIEGVYTVKVVLSDGIDETERFWTVTAGAPGLDGAGLDDSEVRPICGNGVLEEGETCATCSLDARCKRGEVCDAGMCVEKGGAGRAILIFLLLIVGIVGIGFGVYYITTLKKGKKLPEEKSGQFKPKAGKQQPPSEYTDFYNKK